MILRTVIVAAALFLCLSASAAEERFKIYFDQSSANLTNASREVIGFAVKDIREKGARYVAIVGHSDTADMAPLALSRFRAQAVAAELRRLGLPASVTIAVSGVGAEKLAVATGPDVHEPYNRVAVVSY
jgi:outer membrane protein OmpA-like peptidoglycan-associated protein